MSFLYPLEWLSSLLASLLRLGAGSAPKGQKEFSTNMLGEVPVLFEFEGCPFCRLAREAISEAGLIVHVKPCPKGGARFRPKVSLLGGKTQFPFFVDEKHGIAIYESRDIANFVAKTYGKGRPPMIFLLGPINEMLSQFATLARLMAGMFWRKSIENETPLVLAGAERNPATRLVKERLTSMQLDYIWVPGGPLRLKNPATGDVLRGAAKIRAYLLERFRP